MSDLERRHVTDAAAYFDRWLEFRLAADRVPGVQAAVLHDDEVVLSAAHGVADVTTGEPLNDLLGAVKAARAHLLVVGAKGTSRVRHSLLGSVAEGALNSSPVPVLVAR